MREVDRRSKYSRRIFLKGAAAAAPVVAVASSAGLSIEDAWAADATALAPSTMKTLVKVARDIYPHDFLVDSYYITAVKPWDGKAAKDPAVKSLLEDGVRRLDQDAQDRHKVRLCAGGVGGRPCRPAAGNRADRFLQEGSLRSRRLALQPGRAVAEVWLRGLFRRAWRLHQTRFQRHRLAAESLRTSDRTSVGRTSHGKIRSE